MTADAPGSHLPLADRWGRFDRLCAALPEGALAVVDPRVARLHPHVPEALRARSAHLVPIRAGEGAKTLQTLEQLARRAHALSRRGTLICVGGGTLGDLATVAAHLIKRGVSLIQVPTTLLAAVDSSVGGKGAVHCGPPGAQVKNALGVFHYAKEGWLCPELFRTLGPRQLREGAIEAWKMAVCLDAGLFAAYRRRAPPPRRLIRDARALKAGVCAADPYELLGLRGVLNFGHTFGHVLESVTGFRLSHGDAVGLGMLCALDVGRALGITDPKTAEAVESALQNGPGLLGRAALRRALRGVGLPRLRGLLAADKKAGGPRDLRMVLVPEIGAWELAPVAEATWRPLLSSWKEGVRP